jgi:hypothetical protein
MRRAARRDQNESEIIDALRSAGATVYQLNEPFDLLVGFRHQNFLLEIKNPNNTYGKKGFNKNQQQFKENWNGGTLCLVDSVEAALRAINVIKENK